MPEEITNSIGMKLKLIPPGEFLMGSGESAEEIAKQQSRHKPDHFQNECPQHSVKITKPFCLGMYEVTVAQFRQFMSVSGYKTDAEKGGEQEFAQKLAGEKKNAKPTRWEDFAQTDQHPVVCVSWNDAVAFCEWLSEQEGKTYRLPSEAEWEYACRAGTTTRYSFGDDASIGGDDSLSQFSQYATPVGSKKPNAFGLLDMHGNVWEWCGDWFQESYYANSPETDPKGPSNGAMRVLRGGGYRLGPVDVRSSNRYRYPPDHCGNDGGFRVVCEIATIPIAAPPAATADPKSAEKPEPPAIKGVSAGADSPKLLVAPFDQSAAEKARVAWAAHLKVPEEITNSIGMKLKLIPPGEFLMGSPESEEGRSDDEHQHRVQITKPFYLGTYEVTQDEYERVTGAKPSFFSSERGSKGYVSGQDTKRFPVENVSWNDAIAFCEKLGQLERTTYRLLTEAEWEYACRAGTTTPFHFGAESNGENANVNGMFRYGTRKTVFNRTRGKGLYLARTVGAYAPNAFGLFDMHGNVCEWCHDWYDGRYYANSPTTDPAGPESAQQYRVLRGARSAYRVRYVPDGRLRYIGFRVARTP
jgi:formylglycine-generating enzyme required for sulfatase activity